MPESVRVLASFVTPEEAHAARIQLEGAGVRARLADESLVGIMWMLGNAVGGVKLLVAAEDFDRAAAILEQKERLAEETPASDAARHEGADWRCPRCGEEVEHDFDVCWSCGSTREGEIDPEFVPPDDSGKPAEDEFSETSPGGAIVDSEFVPPDDSAKPAEDELSEFPPGGGIVDPRPRALENNPYAAPLWQGASAPADSGADEPAIDEQIVTEIDAVARRAWRAAVIGLFFCPMVLNAYSVWLLFKIAFSDQSLTRRGRRHCFGAWLINMGAAFIVSLIFAQWGPYATLPVFMEGF